MGRRPSTAPTCTAGRSRWRRQGSPPRQPSFAEGRGGAARRRRCRHPPATPRSRSSEQASRRHWASARAAGPSWRARRRPVCVPPLHHPLRRHGAAGPTSLAVRIGRSIKGNYGMDPAIVTQQTPAVAVKTDGRKRRWHQHKVERRNELVDGTLEAIRRRGSNVSMDEIAADIGVSKTVLYRYFIDKNDLTTAVMMRFAQTTLIPNMASALSADLDGYALTREIIRVYVETVASEPEPYQFVMANNSASRTKAVSDAERIIARMLAVMLRHRMHGVGMNTGGVEPWAYHTVGGVQLATHSWMSNPRMSSDELIDYLTMLSWNALCGIVEVGGSLEKFREG